MKLLVASVKGPNDEHVLFYPDGYYAKWTNEYWKHGWRYVKIDNFPYEEGYEYIIYARIEPFRVGDIIYQIYNHVETI